MAAERAEDPVLNEVHLAGRVGSEPEERELPSGDLVVTLEFGEHLPAGVLVLQEPDFIQLLPDQLVLGVAQQPGQEGIGVGDNAGAGVEQKDSIVGGLKETAIADFRSADPLLGPFNCGEVHGHGAAFPPVRRPSTASRTWSMSS